MSTIINGTSSAITFPDTTVQNTAFTTGAVTQSTIATGVAGTGPAFSAYASGGQVISNGVGTKIAFDTKFFDTASCFNTATYRFTPTVAGYYQVSVTLTGNVSSGVIATLLYKNGSQYLNAQIPNNSSGIGLASSTLMYLNGSTDYIEVYMYQTSGGNLTTLSNRPDCYQFSAALVRAA